tara:strand:- start:1928 stop:2443 length:516 start_codon:yes stop_codon:yes gene_type:complete
MKEENIEEQMKRLVAEEPEKIISPFTGKNNCFVQRMNGLESYLCMDSGYTTNTSYKKGSDVIKDAESKAPKLVRDLQYEDTERGLIWFPSVVQVPGIGMIFPDGSSVDDWGYSVAKQIAIPTEEQKNFPVPGKEGAYYQSRLDMENLKTFDKMKFEDACEELKIIEDVENV